MQVIRQRFFTLDDALADIRSRGLWPTTYVVDHATEAGLHWHTEDVYGYILRGSSYALDAAGNRLDVRAGDLIIIPARELHAEGEIHENTITIVALPEALRPDQFLRPHPPEALQSLGGQASAGGEPGR